MSQKQSGNKRAKTGVISVTSRGVGYVTLPDFKEDIEIEPSSMNTALHGDTVAIRLLPRLAGKRTGGEVIKIIERKRTMFVGVLEKERGFCFLVPDDRKVYTDILITNAKGKEIRKRDKALVKLTRWTDPKRDPEGEIVKILGPQGTHEVEMQALVLARGFDTTFPPEVEKEAQEISKERHITEAEIKKRRDFRNTLTFTIDPVTAKDFDDALSIKKLDNGDIEVGIHIADVSHYVRPGTKIEKEAQERGASIYLVDRTIPMLPSVLSDDVCSLNPKEDKLTYSAVFVLDQDGKIKSRWFGSTVIHSDKRFTYEEAQAILDRARSNRPNDRSDRFRDIIRNKEGLHADELLLLDGLAEKLRAERFKNGVIDFDQDEISFELDEAGRPLSIQKKERLATHKLVEDFMLLANREVAAFFDKLCKKSGRKNVTFVYRIHDVPNPEKIEELGIFLRAIGYEFETRDGDISAKEINKLFEKIAGKPEENLIKTATIRSMAKAVYSTKNIGHFGLAFEFYTNFTSPIRRYPDIMVHRILKSHLGDTPISSEELRSYERLALQSSEREVSAVEAERDSIKYKQVEYMKKHIGKTFSGVISGVTEWGIYVMESETMAEGMIKLGNMKDDYYTFDKKGYRLVGQKSKKKYTLGDKVKVELTAANLEDRTLDWTFA